MSLGEKRWILLDHHLFAVDDVDTLAGRCHTATHKVVDYSALRLGGGDVLDVRSVSLNLPYHRFGIEVVITL